MPALFIAGFSLPNSNLQRVFAIIELLRAVAAFMIAPLMLHFAFTVGHSLSSGTTIALWICFGISTGGAIAGVCLYALGGVRPPAPSLERWFGGREPGWYSPPLLARIRRQTNAAPQRRLRSLPQRTMMLMMTPRQPIAWARASDLIAWPDKRSGDD